MAEATWVGGKLTSFWVMDYTYDAQGRILTKTYSSGNLYRLEYPGDSAIYYYDAAGPTPEFKILSEYYDTEYRNPYRLKNYEAAYPINNYIFMSVCSDFSGMTDHPHTQLNNYDDAGKLTGITNFSYGGNVKGYLLTESTYEGLTLRNTIAFIYE